MKNEIKHNVFYGTGDFKKIFENLIDIKIEDTTRNIKNSKHINMESGETIIEKIVANEDTKTKEKSVDIYYRFSES